MGFQKVKVFCSKGGLWIRRNGRIAGLLAFEAMSWLTALVIVWAYVKRYRHAGVEQLTEFSKVVVWPLVVCAGLLALRRPIGQFLSGLSGRLTKFSAFNVEIELRTIKAGTAQSPELTDIMTPLIVNDSSRQIFAQLQDQNRADYIVVDLGNGEEWITSRLFLVAAIFERMRGVRCIVFVEGVGDRKGRFLGTASPHAIRWRLAKAYPWLEVALIKAFSTCFVMEPKTMLDNDTVFLNDEGGLKPDLAANIGKEFIQSLQEFAPQLSTTWRQIGNGIWERGQVVTLDSLKSILGTSLNQSSVEHIHGRPKDEVIEEVLSRSGNFVAAMSDGRFDELIDRHLLLQGFAKTLDSTET